MIRIGFFLLLTLVGVLCLVFVDNKYVGQTVLWITILVVIVARIVKFVQERKFHDDEDVDDHEWTTIDAAKRPRRRLAQALRAKDDKRKRLLETAAQEAIEECRKYTSEYGWRPRAQLYFLLAKIRKEQNQPEQAHKAIKQSARYYRQLDCLDVEVMYWLGMMSADIGREDEALAAYRKALSVPLDDLKEGEHTFQLLSCQQLLTILPDTAEFHGERQALQQFITAPYARDA